MHNNFLSSNILCLSIWYSFNCKFNQNYTIFNCELIPTHYKGNCILVLTTLKTATWVAETCRWSLRNKITYIHSSAFADLFKNFIHRINARNMEHTKHSKLLTALLLVTWTANRYSFCRSQWPRGLRRRSTAARLLGLRVRIPPTAWLSAFCECCVLSGRGLCNGPIPRPEKS